jgi:glutathione-regulated potassium-efflux system ancillary protein KefG
MRKILILFAHPRFEHSVVNRALVDMANEIPNVTLHDLYEEYPDFEIDIRVEQELLLSHQVIIWHHPFYWYSCPPLLKQWIDVVLEYNWAYGNKGTHLSDKYIFNAITTGGAQSAYQKEGRNHYTVNELLAPFEQTAELCKMNYLPPFTVQGTHRIKESELQEQASAYKKLLTYLSDDTNDLEVLKESTFLNDFLLKTTQHGQ